MTISRSYTEFSDSELIFACQRNDEIALKHLLERHRWTIVHFLHKLVPGFKDYSDLIQETNIRIWRSIYQLKDPRAFKSWLKQIVTNLYYDELRKMPRVQIISIDEPVSVEDTTIKPVREIADSSQQPESKMLSLELSDVLEKAVSSIPEQFRKAAMLRDVDGLSYEEIAHLTHTELGTVKSRIARARTKIQKRVFSYLECA